MNSKYYSQCSLVQHGPYFPSNYSLECYFSGVCLAISLASEFLHLINSCVRDFFQFRCKRQLRGFFLRDVLMAEEQLPHPLVVLPPDVPVPEERPAAPPAAAPVVVSAAAPVVENPENAADGVPQEVILGQF